MARDIVSGISTKLQTAGHGTVGTSIFHGPLRPYMQVSGTDIIPRNAIFVSMPTEGLPPYPMAGTSYQKLRRPSVQVMVRRTNAGTTTARAILETLADDLSGYIAVEVAGSGPAYLGPDAEENHLWSINITVIYDERATTFGDGELDFSDADDSAWLTILFSRP